MEPKPWRYDDDDWRGSRGRHRRSERMGAELARPLAWMGVKVGLTARREPEWQTIAASIRAEGETTFVAPADATNPLAKLLEVEPDARIVLRGSGLRPTGLTTGSPGDTTSRRSRLMMISKTSPKRLAGPRRQSA
jgi:hypothetical protein